MSPMGRGEFRRLLPLLDSDMIDLNNTSLVDLRRHFHRHPELSHEEVETCATIWNALANLGLSPKKIAGTGIKVTIKGEHPGPSIGYRADIDALPIQEATSSSYQSLNPGVMHACGHDVHTTVALGLVSELFANRADLHGQVTFLFQPGEEAAPSDTPVGAEWMVKEGALEDPSLDVIFALHCMPDLAVGNVGYTGGPVFAESTLVQIDITGVSAHAALPYEGVDAVVTAAATILALQTVVSRSIDSRNSCVLTIGMMQAGNTYNVVANHATLLGTMRTLDSKTTERAKERIVRIAKSTAETYGAGVEVSFVDGARVTANDLSCERRAVAILQEASKLHSFSVIPHPPQMASEDFSEFSQRVPGCYLFLGVRNDEKGIVHPLHTSCFDVDERCLEVGVMAMKEVILAWHK